MAQFTRRLIIIFTLAVPLFVSNGVYAETKHHHSGDHAGGSQTGLTEAGNDAFGTVQEVVKRLQDDPNTDWSKVDLEALRQHLVDMDNFTKQVSVLSRQRLKSGAELVVRPDSDRARASLQRALAAHPAMMQQETGWSMKVATEGRNFRLTITSPKQADAERIYGLGYIGIMALGDHHQRHHWLMAKGENPHH